MAKTRFQGLVCKRIELKRGSGKETEGLNVIKPYL